jgi:hypothetical protein
MGPHLDDALPEKLDGTARPGRRGESPIECDQWGADNLSEDTDDRVRAQLRLL